jgi:hypothetical protein
MSYKSSIIKALDKLATLNGTRNPDETDNQGAFLGPVFLWETVRDIAADKVKSAWSAVSENNLISTDDVLRDKINGEEILVSSPSFALQVRVTQPRESFDQTLFIEKAAKKFSIDKHKLVELAAQCKKQSRAPLSKKVVEIK